MTLLSKAAPFTNHSSLRHRLLCLRRCAVSFVMVCAVICLGGCVTDYETSRANRDEPPRQVNRVRDCVQRILPIKAYFEVTQKKAEKVGQDPSVIIRASLLEGVFPGEDPTKISRQFASTEGLTRLVEGRTAHIYRTIAQEVELQNGIGGVNVQTFHVVRQSVGNANRLNGPLKIYEAHMPIKHFRRHNWKKMSDAEIIRYWEVKENLIPKLRFQ